MDSQTAGYTITASILIIPLITVGHIILAGIGIIIAFFVIRGLGKSLGIVGKKVKIEAKRIRAERKEKKTQAQPASS